MLVALCTYVPNEKSISAMTLHKAVRTAVSEWRVGNAVWSFFFTYHGMLRDDVSSAGQMERYVRNELLTARFIDPMSCKPDYDVIRNMSMPTYRNESPRAIDR